jgi:hypothetical protein
LLLIATNSLPEFHARPGFVKSIVPESEEDSVKRISLLQKCCLAAAIFFYGI